MILWIACAWATPGTGTNLNVLQPRKFANRKAGQAMPGLSAVYDAVGLPSFASPKQLPAGELRILNDLEVTEFVQELYGPPGSLERTAHPVAKTTVNQAKCRPKGRRC